VTDGAPRDDAQRDDAVGCLARRLIHTGRIVELSIDTVRFPNGTVGELEMIRHSGASAVLPLLDDSADPEILLIRQYRYASGGFMLEVPAGRPDRAGEDWEVCARRELEEETGIVAGNMTHLTTIYTTPGFTDERIRIYLARDCTSGSVSFDHDEFIENVHMRLSEAVALVEAGEIDDAKTICALLLAASRIQPGSAIDPGV
jgi:ADP-ribose pyrophosphatase